MNIQGRPLILLALLVAMILLMSACSQTTTGVAPSNLSSIDVLQKSADAMKQLKSSHVEIKSNSNVQTTGGTSANSSNSTPSGATNSTFALTASGDQALPDGMEQLAIDLNATKLKEVLQGDKVYVQNGQGQWYVFNKSDFDNIATNPFSGVSLDQTTVLGAIENIKLDDHGADTLNGQSMRHITATLDKDAFKAIVSQNPQLKSAFGQQDINTLLKSTKKFLSTVDVWIDEKQFYVHRTQLKWDIDADTSAVGKGAPSNVASTLDTTVDLSNFNVPVTINPPTNAIPTKDPTVIFGKSKV